MIAAEGLDDGARGGVGGDGNEEVSKCIPMYHPRLNRQALVFPDASDGSWGCCVTQVPPGDVIRGRAVEDLGMNRLRS